MAAERDGREPVEEAVEGRRAVRELSPTPGAAAGAAHIVKCSRRSPSERGPWIAPGWTFDVRRREKHRANQVVRL